MLKFGSLELANVSFSGCYIRVILSKDHRNKDQKKSSETKTRDEKIRDVLIHKDRFVSDCFMLASLRWLISVLWSILTTRLSPSSIREPETYMSQPWFEPRTSCITGEPSSKELFKQLVHLLLGTCTRHGCPSAHGLIPGVQYVVFLFVTLFRHIASIFWERPLRKSPQWLKNSYWYSVTALTEDVLKAHLRCPQSTFIHRIPQYIFPRRNWDPPHPLSHKWVCPSPRNQTGGGAHSPAGEGVGESQFLRLEKKLSTLSTLCYCPSLRASVFLQCTTDKFCIETP